MSMLASSDLQFDPGVLPNTAKVPTQSIEIPKESKPKTTEEIVKEYFKDTPILANIAYCESKFRQFDKDGSVLRGEQNKDDVGVMQINIKYHLKTAEKLGLDLYTLEGNMAYGKYLYEKNGTNPWVYSSPCWIPRSNLVATVQ